MNNSSENVTVFQEIFKTANEWTLLQLLLAIFLGLVTLTTIVGNGVVLYVFAKSKKALRSPCHILLANLAMADFMVGTSVMPILLSVTMLNFKWYWGDLMCQLVDYGHFLLCATSMLSMVAVCLERYVGVRYPMHHKRILTKRRMIYISGGIWLVALILSAGPLSVWPVKGQRTPFTCGWNLRHDFLFFVSLSLYWLPIGIIVYVYWLIYKTSTIPSADLMKWAKKSLGSVVSTVSVSSRRRSSKSDEEKFERARLKQKLVLRKMTKLILGMLIFYGPVFFMFLLKGLQVPWFSMDLLLAFAWLRYISSCTNTFLYIHVVPYYKQQLLRLLCNMSSSSKENRSEATTTVRSSENDPSSSSFYSSSAERGTGRTVVINSSPSVTTLSSSPKLKPGLGTYGEKTSMSTPTPSVNFGDRSHRNTIQDMEDILTKIDMDMKLI